MGTAPLTSLAAPLIAAFSDIFQIVAAHRFGRDPTGGVEVSAKGLIRDQYTFIGSTNQNTPTIAIAAQENRL